MERKSLFPISCMMLIFPFVFALLAGCKDQEREQTRTYVYKKPVLMKVADLRALQILPSQPKPLVNPGKIYVYEKYLLINEPLKGIHVVDNSKPYAPRMISFISIPGNADMAVNSNILYADNYVDLLAFDISDPKTIRMVQRVQDVFPQMYMNKQNGTFWGYKDTVVTEIVPTGGVAPSFDMNAASGGKSYGHGGSMARFTLMNDYLYTVNNYELRLFDVAYPTEPKYVNNINLGWGIETIFPYRNKLFIGSTTGMHIYDAANPSAPTHLSTYRHFTSCDPVVVDGKFAYVTLRSGSFCRQGVNQLDVLNIEDPTHPTLVSTFPMKNPHGLGVAGDFLYICEGEYGLKSFNKANPYQIGSRQIEHLQQVKAVDVIPGPASLIVTGPDGIYQYNYRDPGRLRPLSKIPVMRTLY